MRNPRNNQQPPGAHAQGESGRRRTQGENAQANGSTGVQQPDYEQRSDGESGAVHEENDRATH
jgi:hypothetical protein